MSQPLLFNTNSLSRLEGTTDAKVRRSIELLTLASFSGTTAEAIATTLYADNRLLPASVQTGSATQAYPQEIRLEVQDEAAPKGSRLADGRRFRFYIPYTGNKEMLQVMAPTTTARPFGTVELSVIQFDLEQAADGNIEDIVAAYQLNMSRMAGNATALEEEIQDYNASLQQLINSGVAARKARLDKDIADAQSIGVPFAS